MPADSESSCSAISSAKVHQQLGALTGQLHDSLTEFGLAAKVKDWTGKLSDAKIHLSYIAGLNGEATENMMAQDFHDLNGQVIARVVNLAATVEDQLMPKTIRTSFPTHRTSDQLASQGF